MPFTGALFDMDGLLLDTERVGLRSFQNVMAPLGMDSVAAHEFFLTLIGGTYAGTVSALGAVFPEKSGEALHDLWRAQFKRDLGQHVPLRPTVVEALTLLADHGVPMVVVTSTHRNDALHHLELAGIASFFRGIVAGDEVTRGKPDPEPYQKGAALLGLDPGACCAFEDSDPGTLAAVAAGCHVWQIPDLRPPGVALPEVGQHVAETLHDAVRDTLVEVG